jgi:transforming growth factor-beta-induced protein
MSLVTVRRFQTLIALSLFAATTLSVRTASANHPDIVETAVQAGSFNTLATALKAANLLDALRGKGPFTVFAPTDDAFAKLPKGQLEELLRPENQDILAAILTYHVAPGRVMAKEALELKAVKTLNGQRVEIAVDDGKVRVDGAKVVKVDVAAGNGVIHVIDEVILPSTLDIVETAAKAGSFKTLATALKAASLVETLQGSGPFTVFAPSDDAFSRLPKGTVETLVKPENVAKLRAILTYHVVPGRVFSTDLANGGEAKTVQGDTIAIKVDKKGVRINDSQVVQTDIDAANGVIHVIDTVLMPPADKTASSRTSGKACRLALENG